MKILTINSSGKRTEVAFVDTEKNVTDYIIEPSFKKASEALLNSVDVLLEKNGVDIKQIDAFGVCLGPGSFTGIRIGVTTVRTFCDTLKKSAIVFTNLDTLAYNNTNENNKTNKNTLVISDASNGFFYTAEYDADKNIVNPPQVLTFLELENLIETKKAQKDNYEICTELDIKQKIEPLVKANLIDAGFVFTENDTANGLISATLNAQKTSGLIDYTKIEPLYIRKPQAELDKEKLKNK